MKRFKDLVKQLPNWKNSPLSFPSSFGEIRQNLKNLSWDELSHEERKQIEQETLSQHRKSLKEWYQRTGKEFEVDGRMDPIHNEIRGYGHHKKHTTAIWNYSSSPKQNRGRSSIINGYLKHKAEGTLDQFEHKDHEDEIRGHINNLSDSFRKNLTVRKAITTYGGVPKRIGDAISKGGEFKLNPFTSTSTNGYTALAFAKRYAKNRNHEGEYHMIKYHIDKPGEHQPGNAQSIAPFADLAENEVLLHHGTHIQHMKTEQHNVDDGILHVHHVRVLHDDDHKQV